MEFLFKDRGSGKRAIKPSKEAEILEALIPDHESDDSDFEVDKHKGGDNSDDNDSDEEKSASEDGSDDSSDSDNEGNSDNDSPDEDEVLRLKSNLTTEELISLAKRQTQTNKSQEGGGPAVRKVCGMCLGTNSDHTNEIVECDGCGVSVHESCYGIQETGSITSNASSACTEPWFCDVCIAGLTSSPQCELCPNIGGIYKQTDTGSWIHLVCGLYIPHVSFFDQERITRPTLFELNYQSWGRRACILCRNIKYARTGVCIECDAGMCKSYFHVTCAQEAGLLSEPSEDDHEQFFGHCKAHSDREQIKRRRKNWLSHQLNYRSRGAVIQAEREADKLAENTGQKETPSQRNLRKLSESRVRWENSKQKDHWIPTQKMSRLLLTSSKAVKKFQRKAELHEWNVEAMEEEEHNKQVVAEIRKKWHVTPAFTVEYVAYYHDRSARIKEMQETLAEAVIINNQLKEEDEETCANYRAQVVESDQQTEQADQLKKIYKMYKDLLVKFDPLDRGLKSPNRVKTPVMPPVRSDTSRSVVGSVSKTLLSCHICQGSQDQHLLATCDICKHSYHIFCLTPPLSKMPRKTKQYGWQCSECDKGDPSTNLSQPLIASQEIDLEAPRASRARGQTSRLSSVIQSDSDAESVRNLQDVEIVAETQTPDRRQNKKLKTQTPVESTPKPAPCDISSSSTSQSTPTVSSSSSPTKSGKKRGRPVGWRKYKDGETPPSKVRKGRKDQTSSSSTPNSPILPSPVSSSSLPPSSQTPAVASVAIVEPDDNIVTSSADASLENVTNNDPVVSESKTNEDNSEEKLESNEQISEEIPPNLPPKKFFKSKAAAKEISRVSPPPIPEQERDNFRNWLDAKLSPIKVAHNITSNGLVEDKDVEDNLNKKNDASDDSSADENEVSPDKNGSFLSDKEEREARKERKRLKREEKEKRREERRKKKLMKSQDILVCNIVEERPEIEEDEDSCVVRIAPKPIKLKIKPLTKPEEKNDKSSDFAIVNSEEDKCTTNHVRERSLSPVTNMHPKKKLAHMTQDSLLVNNFPVVNNLIHSTLPFLHPVPPVTNNHQPSVNNKLGSLPPSLPIIHNNKKVVEHNNILATRNGIDHHDDYEFKDEEANKILNLPKPPPPVKPKKSNNENSGKKGRDVRTKCDVCLGEGTNANLVRCDECLKCYHFGCLNPPVKKTPKVSGWAWSCSDCAPSDEDKGWHL